MNKGEFINYISAKHSCTKVDAEKTIDMFTLAVIDALGAGNKIGHLRWQLKEEVQNFTYG